MTFAVTACGHSGTMYLVYTLNQVEGWTVRHEPDPDESISFRTVNKRFENKKYYGEVNTYLLSCFDRIDVDCKAVVLRNPYDICHSIARSGYGQRAVMYVRESISRLDCLIASGIPAILFRKMTTDAKYVVKIADRLGVELPLKLVNTQTKINEHHGDEVALAFSTKTRSEFDAFIRRYGL